jgi:hypothetical protein
MMACSMTTKSKGGMTTKSNGGMTTVVYWQQSLMVLNLKYITCNTELCLKNTKHPCSPLHTHVHTHPHTRTHTHAHTHIYTHAQTHTHTCTHTRAHPHPHSHHPLNTRPHSQYSSKISVMDGLQGSASAWHKGKVMSLYLAIAARSEI